MTRKDPWLPCEAGAGTTAWGVRHQLGRPGRQRRQPRVIAPFDLKFLRATPAGPHDCTTARAGGYLAAGLAVVPVAEVDRILVTVLPGADRALGSLRSPWGLLWVRRHRAPGRGRPRPRARRARIPRLPRMPGTPRSAGPGERAQREPPRERPHQ